MIQRSNGLGKAGRWVAGQLGGMVFAYIVGPAIALLLAVLAALFAAAKNAPSALIALLALAVFAIVTVTFVVLYTVKIGPWLATFRPDPPPYRQLGNEADELAQAIYRFEMRDPAGNPLKPPGPAPLSDLLNALSAPPDRAGAADVARESDDWSRFDDAYGQMVRSLFHELKDARLVIEGEMVLFYTPRTSADRIALAGRLQTVAYHARELG